MNYKTQYRAVAAATKILAVHDAAMGLEHNMDRETQVWHVMLSLLAFCDVHHIDLDVVLADVREDEAEELS